MKKRNFVCTAVLAVLAVFAVLTGCSKIQKKDSLKIGVLQLVEHDALDSAFRGFKDALEEAGYFDGKNIEIDYQNAQGEQANCQTIAQKFINDR